MMHVEGRLCVRAWKRGKVLWELEKHNLKVNGALPIVANLIGGTVANQSVTAVGFGSGTGTPVVTNTQLTGPAYFKALSGVSYPVAGDVQFTWVLSYSGDVAAQGINIQELGLFCNTGAISLPYSDPGGSPPNMTLFARVTLGLGLMTSGASYTATWTETVS